MWQLRESFVIDAGLKSFIILLYIINCFLCSMYYNVRLEKDFCKIKKILYFP